tara:strand:- start:311 stop:475 length:165 start_codon:yes stop_codon:yes gene_type:complete
VKELKINRGVELMMRRPKPKEPEPEPSGLHISKTFNLLKRKVYFNFEFRWEKEQ